MQIHSAEEAKKRFDSLPQEIKNMLYGPEMTFVIQQIGQKNHLHIDQIDFLNTETGQVMLGFVEAKDFANELMESLDVDKDKALTIAKDVDEMLFSKIREQMKTFYEAHKEQPTIATPPAEPTPPPQPVSKLPPLPDRSAPQQILSATPVAPTPPPVAPPPPIKPISEPASPTPATPDLHAADVMLNQKTIDIPVPQAPQQGDKTQPPAPGAYKKDPYREPVE